MYKVKLNTFEGPLDLLLFFIKRDELDIYDIPISRITKEFIGYLSLMEKLDLEVAGDFLLMASTLMLIKVRMLLPKEVDEKGEEIDPRSDLVNALLEYKRYKEMAEEFSVLESHQRKINYRGYFSADNKEAPPELDKLLKNITIYDLISAFKNALAEKPKDKIHEINRINISLEDQIEYIMGKIKDSNSINFIDLVLGITEKLRIVVTFIALLELVKMNRIGLKESRNYNDFIIYGISNG
ncbi:segregation and condensation protein A [bacterium BMS3Abin04]|nr:segregation and condensation protein A [bacterium BMS3Abin04]